MKVAIVGSGISACACGVRLKEMGIPFTILEKTEDDIAGEAIGSRKCIGPAAMDMDESPVRGSDPQTAIAIPQQSSPFMKLLAAGRERILFEFPVNKLLDSAAPADQEGSVIAIEKRVPREDHARQRKAIQFWQRKVLRWTRPPTP